MTPRFLAYNLLIKIEKSKQYSNIALDNALLASDMSDADKRLASILFYGVIERKISLDYRISILSSRKLNSLDASVLTALRLGLYQLIYLDRIPPHAAINETVALCSGKSKGFVNAILRAHTRQKDFALPDKSDFAKYLSVKYSICPPLAEKFISVFGDNEVEAVLEGFVHTPETTVRVPPESCGPSGKMTKTMLSAMKNLSSINLRITCAAGCSETMATMLNIPMSA